ncbi:MAG: DUF6168 family protein [Psychroserpens sp.]|uniref:DUF6168 family protein n=1 Tax=Psychroserpens sp. TaxID=2020870 RepID=UPI003C7167E6
MIKRTLIYTAAFAVLFGVLFFLQNAFLHQTEQRIRFNTLDTTLFLALASFIICIHFEIFSTFEKLRPQLGFIYLPTLFIKGILFFITFKSSVFALNDLTTFERLNLLIPLLLFLGLEVFFITEILKRKE